MSGTLFIVCIPTGDKEKVFKDNDVRDKKISKSFLDEKSSELIEEPHKVKSITLCSNSNVCINLIL